jgi:hypothetical protein
MARINNLEEASWQLGNLFTPSSTPQLLHVIFSQMERLLRSNKILAAVTFDPSASERLACSRHRFLLP